LCNICVERGRETSDYVIHTHDFSELVIITSGKATHVIGDEEYTVKPGDAFVINGDVAHGYRNVQELELFNIPFHADRVFQNHAELKKLAGFQALFILEPYYRRDHEFKSRLTLSPMKLIYADQLFRLMENEFVEQKEGFQQAVEGLFLSLVVLLSREYFAVENDMSERLKSLAETVAYIENHYTQPLGLVELSEMAHFSPRHFARVFKQNYLLTPRDYIVKLRMNEARKLLADNRLSIGQVAGLSGFSDSNYFSRIFKKEMGVAAKEYRKKFSVQNN
jgi:AraC family L-rhamnose operon transcriptional activator RhaR/AraC family L-rhamnose operon regulatory protein RhaS